MPEIESSIATKMDKTSHTFNDRYEKVQSVIESKDIEDASHHIIRLLSEHPEKLLEKIQEAQEFGEELSTLENFVSGIIGSEGIEELINILDDIKEVNFNTRLAALLAGVNKSTSKAINDFEKFKEGLGINESGEDFSSEMDFSQIEYI